MTANAYYAKPGTAGVYALIDPRTEEVRYIGSSVNIETRYRTHINGGDSGRKAINHWIEELKGAGLVPLVKILWVGQDAEKRKTAEFEEIDAAILAGAALCNVHLKRTGYTKLQAENLRLKAVIAALEQEIAQIKLS